MARQRVMSKASMLLMAIEEQIGCVCPFLHGLQDQMFSRFGDFPALSLCSENFCARNARGTQVRGEVQNERLKMMM